MPDIFRNTVLLLLAFILAFFNDLLHVIRHINMLLLTTVDIALLLHNVVTTVRIYIESEVVTWIVCTVDDVRFFWDGSLVASQTQRDHRREVLLRTWFLAALEFGHMEALLKDGVLEQVYLEIGVEILVNARSECTWRVVNGIWEAVTVNVTPNRACDATLFLEEREHLECFRLIHHAERAIGLVYVRAPLARVVLSKIIAQSMQLPLILPLKSVDSSRGLRLSW